MDLPVEVVEEADDAPFLLILAKLAGVSLHDGFNGDAVPAGTFLRRELGEDLPGAVPQHQRLPWPRRS